MGVTEKLKEEQSILRILKREILKCAKKGDTHYYWDVGGLGDTMVKSICSELEKDGKHVNSKGTNFKIIKW